MRPSAWLLPLVAACSPVVAGGTVEEDTGDTGATSDTAAPAGPLALCINELMPANDDALVLEDGRTPDWIELHNDSGAVVDLAGWTVALDDGTPADLGDNGRLGSGDWLVLHADEGAGAGHLPFRLDADGGAIALRAPDGNGEDVRFGHVEDDWAVARTHDCCRGADCLAHVYHGTPGASNAP
jgi:hypothetical protein